MKRASSVATALIICVVLSVAQARCAPRAIDISYAAAEAVPISVHRVCNGKRCGAALASLASGCTEVACLDGSRCNTCSARLRAADLPAGSAWAKYGIYFSDNPVAAYNFTADWSDSTSGPDWFKRNGWVAGCKPRVGCITRGDISCTRIKGSIKDVAITADGCYTKLFLKILNAPSLRDCIARNMLRFGVPKGQVYGKDCPSRPI